MAHFQFVKTSISLTCLRVGPRRSGQSVIRDLATIFQKYERGYDSGALAVHAQNLFVAVVNGKLEIDIGLGRGQLYAQQVIFGHVDFVPKYLLLLVGHIVVACVSYVKRRCYFGFVAVWHD